MQIQLSYWATALRFLLSVCEQLWALVGVLKTVIGFCVQIVACCLAIFVAPEYTFYMVSQILAATNTCSYDIKFYHCHMKQQKLLRSAR